MTLAELHARLGGLVEAGWGDHVVVVGNNGEGFYTPVSRFEITHFEGCPTVPCVVVETERWSASPPR